MNINCTSACIYQSDGKCNLNEAVWQESFSYGHDCPYYTEKSF